MIATVIEKIAKRGVIETVSKVYEHVRSVFRLAQARGLRQDNPADPVREVLPMAKKKGHMPALLTFPALGDLLRRAESSRMSPAIRMAHRLCAFTAPRISNVVQAEWSEFDLEADVPTWIIPRKKMKSKDRIHDHQIILGEVIAEELREWRRNTGTKGYIFPSSAGGKHIVAESLEKIYQETLALRGKRTPHSWRSALSMLARDNGVERDVVEITLDHIHDNDVLRACDCGERLQQRIKLMNCWCAQLADAATRRTGPTS